MPIDQAPYLSAFRILEGDFRRLLEFVEPVDANRGTYSHRLYELLLRACTEFESICKELLVQGGSQRPPKAMNINDYKTLNVAPTLEKQRIGILTWRPRPDYVIPLEHWTASTPPLKWYQDYNEVKHNRTAEFARGNLGNVCTAMAGLFAMHVAAEVI